MGKTKPKEPARLVSGKSKKRNKRRVTNDLRKGNLPEQTAQKK